MAKNCCLEAAEKPSTVLGDFAQNRRQRSASLDLSRHALTGLLFNLWQRGKELGAFLRVGYVVRNRSAQQRAQILRGVGQRGVWADGDAIHALGAVLGNEERGLTSGYVFRCSVAGGGGNHAHGRERRGGLVIAKVCAELGVEGGDAGQRSARGLTGGQRVGAATSAASAACGDLLKNRHQSRAAQGRMVSRRERADFDLLHLLVALHHDFHVGLDDGLAQLAELA